MSNLFLLISQILLHSTFRWSPKGSLIIPGFTIVQYIRLCNYLCFVPFFALLLCLSFSWHPILLWEQQKIEQEIKWALSFESCHPGHSCIRAAILRKRWRRASGASVSGGRVPNHCCVVRLCTRTLCDAYQNQIQDGAAGVKSANWFYI